MTGVVAECQKNEWIRTVSSRELNWARAGSLAALLLLVAALFGLRTVPTLQAHLASKGLSRKVTVTPGDAKVERGSGLVVLARFAGPLPPEATLVIGKGTNSLRRIPLAKTLNDPVFGGSIPEVNSNLFYHIEFADEQTPEYKVTVFEHPRMERADAKIKYPEYTGLSEKKIEDTRRISAVEGSKLELDQLWFAGSVRSLHFPSPWQKHRPTLYRREERRDGASAAQETTSHEEAFSRELDHFFACVTGTERPKLKSPLRAVTSE